MITDRIKALSEGFLPEVIKLRHHFHKYPELGFKEVGTAEIVAKTLEGMGIEIQKNVAKTGVVGLIRGHSPGKTVLLRADMDALQVQEETDVLYKSVNPGLMHACGHDGHTAGLLGVAMILNELKSELQGNVKLIFQPAEENEGGALPMIEAGVLENPRVDAAFGCHLWGSVKEGNVQIKYGAMMASPDSFRFKIIGRGGHAAMPHLTIDPVMITVQVINQMQSIVSRRINPLLPAVISFTTIHGGETHNVIPNEVEVTGTIRVFDKSLRQWIPETMESTLKHIAEANNASYEFQLMPKFPPLINDKDMTNLAHSSISKVVGIKNVETAILPNMGGEDFAYFAEKVPSSFYFVGIAPNDENHVIHHHPKFSWDDKNLLIVTQTLSQIAYDFLNQ